MAEFGHVTDPQVREFLESDTPANYQQDVVEAVMEATENAVIVDYTNPEIDKDLALTRMQRVETVNEVYHATHCERAAMQMALRKVWEV